MRMLRFEVQAGSFGDKRGFAPNEWFLVHAQSSRVAKRRARALYHERHPDWPGEVVIIWDRLLLIARREEEERERKREELRP